MKNRHNRLKFEKSISRDWCLTNAELHQESFTQKFAEQLGWGLTEVIYEGQDNLVTVYNPQAEYRDGMRDFIISKLKHDKNWIEKQSAIIIKEVKGAEKYLKTAYKKLSGHNNKDLLSIFNEYVVRNYQIWPRFLLIVMFPMQMENHKMFAKYSKAVSVAIKTRKLIEKVGPLLEDFGANMAKLIALKTKIEPKLSRYISYKEVFKYLIKGIAPNKEILYKRSEYYIVTNKGVLLESINKYFEKNNYFLEQLDISYKNKIKGQGASPGKIIGKVNIVLNKTMFSQLKKGEVLVTSMTTPDYLPLMKKAVAFITDEGGITCHAAIVSRELKKPCIIGTKIATKVLHDGDLVEVDADNGVIKILKKN